MEYAGYLVSEIHGLSGRQRNSYICWDEAPEVAVGGTNQDEAIIYTLLKSSVEHCLVNCTSAEES